MSRIGGVDDNLAAGVAKVLGRFPAVEKAFLYGSRARGDYRPDSDIDLAVQAPEMDFPGFLSLKAALADLPLIFKIDLVQKEMLENDALREQIERDAVLFYERKRP